jgi:hypothetical protein
MWRRDPCDLDSAGRISWAALANRCNLEPDTRQSEKPEQDPQWLIYFLKCSLHCCPAAR